MFRMTLIVAWLYSAMAAADSKITVTSGTLVTIKGFESTFVAPRDVHVWMPEGYQSKSAAGNKFAVLYMHDGQMLFDAATTWNKQEWGVDEVVGELIKNQKVRPFIVVGINNGEDLRHPEYIPQRPFSEISDELKSRLKFFMDDGGKGLLGDEYIQSDNYLKFLTQELKPYIDENYSVSTAPKDTAIMGSSMGGLISLYAISEYPEVFGMAACVSTHWPGVRPGDNNPVPDIFYHYMKKHLPDPTTHRLYFDYGTETLDAHYPPLQKVADEIVADKGYSDSNWKTLEFKGAAHTEDDWKVRLHIPMTFLFGR